MNHHVLYSFGSAVTSGQCGLPILLLPPPLSCFNYSNSTLNTHEEAIRRCYPLARGVIGEI